MKASIVDRVTASDVLRRAGIETEKRGKRLYFLCPAHADRRRPSAVVVGERGWYCFTCGAKGGVLDLAVALGLARDRACAARFLETLQ
jgi:DNA primase